MELAVSRTEKRATFAPDQRIVLLEQDADVFDQAMIAISMQLKRLMMAVVGAAISFSTAAVLLAINLGTRLG